jgi:hypothetical protein
VLFRSTKYSDFTPEQKERYRIRRRERFNSLTPEQKEEIVEKRRELWRNLSPERKKDMLDKRREQMRDRQGLAPIDLMEREAIRKDIEKQAIEKVLKDFSEMSLSEEDKMKNIEILKNNPLFKRQEIEESRKIAEGELKKELDTRAETYLQKEAEKIGKGRFSKEQQDMLVDALRIVREDKLKKFKKFDDYDDSVIRRKVTLKMIGKKEEKKDDEI